MSDAEACVPSKYITNLVLSLSDEALLLLEDSPGRATSSASSPISNTWLGQMDYVESIKLTQTLPQEQIWGVEYPLTITLGKRADPLKDIKASLKILREKNIQIVGVDRGGHATLHNPGQLVIYPHLNIRNRQIKVRNYVALIEATTKRFLRGFGIESATHGDEPGLFTARGKIAFFGVRVQRGMTSHGLAINVRNSLTDFSLIRSCGKSEETFSAMQDFGVNAPLSYLFSRWCEELFLTLASPPPYV